MHLTLKMNTNLPGIMLRSEVVRVMKGPVISGEGQEGQ